MANNQKILSLLPTARVKKREDFNKEVEEILQEFDFSKVHSAMVALDWKWCIEGRMRVPTLAEVREYGKNHIEDVVREVLQEGQLHRRIFECGGFSAEFDPHKGLTLRFVLEDWEADDSLDPWD